MHFSSRLLIDFDFKISSYVTLTKLRALHDIFFRNMLFSRVYNWIKYKTLPPSVLFLNRLFVERDSKHRCVLSNLGLTFRNSKWSMYARTNVQDGGYAHLHMHLLTFLSLTGITLTMHYVLSYYSFVPVFNCLLSPI